MSWTDLSLNPMIIITGDGREYNPLWKDPKKTKEYNINRFESPGIKGSKVSRGTPKGRKIPLKIFFTGDNHLIEAEAFHDSADDSRHWVVTHPYYGTFNAHPAEIGDDNTVGNMTEIEISLFETIIDDNPKSVVVPIDKINFDTLTLAEQFSASFVVGIPKPDIRNINLMQRTINNVYKQGVKKIDLSVQAQQYLQFFNTASNEIFSLTQKPLTAIRSTLALMNYPAQFTSTVKARLQLLTDQFSLVGTELSSIIRGNRRSDKVIYEKVAGTVVATMAQSAITLYHYDNTNDVLDSAGRIADTYNEYIDNVDRLQTDNGADPESYIPDYQSMTGLEALVNYTITNLMAIAIESKQERSVVLEYDSNPISLAHRFYGLVPDDSTIDYLIRTNNFGINDILSIRKGTPIKYYV